jgi:hypothetical protein
MKKDKYKSLEELFSTVSKEYGVDVDIVNRVYESVFKFMGSVIKGLPEIKSMEIKDIGKLEVNFYIPKFARFFIDLKKVKRKLRIKN